MTSTGGKITAASLLLHSPIKRRHSLSSIPGNRRLQSGGIEASSTPAIEGTRPPPSCLCPIKGCPALGEDHTSNAPSLSPQRDLTAALPSRGSATGETPLHCPRTVTTLSLNSPAHPSPPPPLGRSSRAPEQPEAELPSAAMAAGPRCTGLARSTDSWTWSTGFSLEKPFLEILIFSTLHLGPSSFSISTRSP
jgi:hypothetical protein